ncbi:MAG: efflux RND transporter periplasmic adaptor subunit [Verrucomicrobium sp.]|nr:efflux RND transporter periplasmic adaptor subunit [Verrucomicrobium sp.]
MKSPLITTLAGCALLALASCSHGKAEATTAPPPPPEAPPVQVATQAAVEQPMPRYLRVTGQLQGARQAMVAADAAGKVVEAPIERGTLVKTGDVLIRLDDRNAKLSLQEAEASLAETQLKVEWQKSELARNEPLAKTKAISDSDFQKRKVDVASAEASLAAALARRDQAQKTVNDVVIRAPFGGTVAERLTELGEYVGNNSEVASLVETTRLRLQLNIPEPSVGRIKEGQKVEFNVPAYHGRNFVGTVKFIGASVRESARDLIIEAEVPNEDGQLKPGMFAEGRMVLPEEPGVAVPLNALRVDGQTRKLFVVSEDRIMERLVEVGETKGDLVEIRTGVTKGEKVVVAPGPEAADGVRVKLTAQL